MIIPLPWLFILLSFDWCTGAPHNYPSRSSGICTTASPSLMVPIHSSSPYTYFNQSKQIVLRQEPSGQTDCLLAFSIPENSYGCKLELKFPPGYSKSVSDSHHISFWELQDEISSSCCWNDAPSMAQYVGTAVLQPNISNIPVGALPCNSNMYFRVCMSAANSSLSFSVPQGVTEGVFLKYNC